MVRSCGIYKKLLGRIEKVKRYEIIRGLESIQEMSDKEIECNAQFIRDVASSCYGLFGSMNKVVVENQKMRKTILNQIGRIANLEKNQKYEEKKNGCE
jgi:hypothetical protein